MLGRWLKFDEALSHGLVIIFIFFSVYIKRVSYIEENKNINLFAGLLLLISTLIWFLAVSVNINIVEQISLILILLSLQVFLFGFKKSMPLIGPVLFLTFAIPLWDYLTPSLVDLSSAVVGYMVRNSNVLAYIEGNSVYFSTGTIVIADGCSGLRYLVISLALCFYIFLTSRLSMSRKLIYLSFAIMLGLITNWLRIYIIIMMAYYTDMTTSLVTEGHETFGWILFCFIAFPVLYFTRNIEHYESQGQVSIDKPFTMLQVLISTILVSVGPLLYAYKSPNIGEHHLHAPGLPIENIVYTSDKPRKDSFIGSEDMRIYKYAMVDSHGDSILVEVAKNWQVEKGGVLVPYVPSIFDKDKWNIENRESLQLGKKTKSSLFILKEKFQENKKIILFWFEVGSQTTGNYKLAKLLQFPALLFGQNMFGFYKITVHCQGLSCENSLEEVIKVANQLEGY